MKKDYLYLLKKHLYYTDVLVTKQENGLLQCQFYRRIFEKNK